jgi:hypothetical protein
MNTDVMSITKAEDAKARRAAKRAGLRIVKSRNPNPLNNMGGYMPLDSQIPVAGFDYDLWPQDVVDFCREW